MGLGGGDGKSQGKNSPMNDIDSGYYKNQNQNQNQNQKNTTKNGYVRGDNKGKVGIPGYSFLDPNLWNVPQKRTPVCHQPNNDDRKLNSLDPAGYMHGGHSGVMEFHGVGYILPKFEYKENTQQIPDKTKRL